jgi:hypothetical protein
MKLYKFLFVIVIFISPSVFAGKDVGLKMISSYLSPFGKNQTNEILKRKDAVIFKHDDIIYYFANYTWENLEKNGGQHKALFKWYSNGTPVGAPFWKGRFETAPWELHSTMVAATLGYGKHKIEFYLDGKLIDTKEFEVKAEESNDKG